MHILLQDRCVRSATTRSLGGLSIVPYALIILSMLWQCACASPPERVKRGYTVDDMLKIEGIGDVRFVRGGASILLEYLPPYKQRGQYGIERGGRILQLSSLGKGHATPLFKHRSGEKYWLGDISPDGRRILVFQAGRGGLKLGFYDFQTKELTFIDDVPHVNQRFEMNGPIWISAEEIVFSSMGQDRTEYGIQPRPRIANWIARSRQQAFAGSYSGASISTSPAEPWFDGHLARYNVNTGRISVVETGRFGSFTLSADGTKLAALRLGPRVLHFPVEQLKDYYRFETQLYVFDLENKRSQSLLPQKHVAMGSLRWSQPGSMLSFFAWDRMTRMSSGSHHVMMSGTIAPIHVDGLTPTWINIGGFDVLKKPIFGEWLQGKLIIHGQLKDEVHQPANAPKSSVDVSQVEKVNWYAVDLHAMTAEALIESHSLSPELYRLGDGRLLLRSGRALFVASESTSPVRLDLDMHGAVRMLGGSRSSEISNQIVFVRDGQNGREVGFFEFAEGRLSIVPLDTAEEVVAWSPERQQVVTRSDADEGGTLTLRGASENPLVVFTFNEHLSEVEHPRWATIEYRGVDGLETFSCIVLPYNYDPRKSYPAIVDVYPGTGQACVSGSSVRGQPLGSRMPFHNNNDLLSANGYLVVVPSNTYKLNQLDGTLYGGLKPQVDVVLDALAATGKIDPERIGIWGFSNGSMASLWLATVSSRYKAVVAMFGASSPYFEYFGGASSPRFQPYLGTPIVHLLQYESDPGTMPLSMGESAISDPFSYITASPLARIKHIDSPVMLVHSDLDGFTQFHYEALFSAMYRLGKRGELVRYYGEGHGLRSPGNIRDFYRRVLAFFEENVATSEPTEPSDPSTVH